MTCYVPNPDGSPCDECSDGDTATRPESNYHWSLEESHWTRVDGVRFTVGSKPLLINGSQEIPAWAVTLPVRLTRFDGSSSTYTNELTLNGELSIRKAMARIDELFPLAPWMTEPMPAGEPCVGPWYPHPPLKHPYGPMLCEVHGDKCPEAENMRHRIEDHHTPDEWALIVAEAASATEPSDG